MPLPGFAKYTGELYDTSSQNTSAKLKQYTSQLESHNVTTVIRYFGIEKKPRANYMNDTDEGLGELVNAVQKHPGVFTPFFTFGLGGSDTNELSATTQANMYERNIKAIRNLVGPDLVMGLGEIEQYAWDAPFDSPKVRKIFRLAERYDLMLMIHPKVGQLDQVSTVLADYPNVVVLMHMYRQDFVVDREPLLTLMEEHPKLYFSIDADHLMFDANGSPYPIGLLFKYQDMSVRQASIRFKNRYAALHDTLLVDAVNDYRPLIEAYPNRVMWGTESYPKYNYNGAVYRRTINFSREFIGSFDASVQSKLGYKNAERIFGKGVRFTE